MNTLGRSGQKPWLPNRVGSREYEGTSPVLRRYRGTKIQSRKFNLIGKGTSWRRLHAARRQSPAVHQPQLVPPRTHCVS